MKYARHHEQNISWNRNDNKLKYESLYCRTDTKGIKELLQIVRVSLITLIYDSRIIAIMYDDVETRLANEDRGEVQLLQRHSTIEKLLCQQQTFHSEAQSLQFALRRLPSR